jgi:hypothetical protein
MLKERRTLEGELYGTKNWLRTELEPRLCYKLETIVLLMLPNKVSGGIKFYCLFYLTNRLSD